MCTFPISQKIEQNSKNKNLFSQKEKKKTFPKIYEFSRNNPETLNLLLQNS